MRMFAILTTAAHLTGVKKRQGRPRSAPVCLPRDRIEGNRTILFAYRRTTWINRERST